MLLGIRWKGNLRLLLLFCLSICLIFNSFYTSLEVVRLPPCADTSMITVYYLLLVLRFNSISLGLAVFIIVPVVHL